MKKSSIIRTGISLIPMIVLVTLLILNISFFGSDAILGASQVALLFSAGICVWLAMWLFKKPWQDFEDAIKSNIGDVTTAIVILFLIGGSSVGRDSWVRAPWERSFRSDTRRFPGEDPSEADRPRRYRGARSTSASSYRGIRTSGASPCGDPLGAEWETPGSRRSALQRAQGPQATFVS